MSMENPIITDVNFQSFVRSINTKEAHFALYRLCSTTLQLTFFAIRVFEIIVMTPDFFTKWRYRVAHSQFNIPKNHFYEYRSSHFKIMWVERDLSQRFIVLKFENITLNKYYVIMEHNFIVNQMGFCWAVV